MLADTVMCLFINHRADIGCQYVRVAETTFRHRAFQHFNGAIGHILWMQSRRSAEQR